MFWLIGVIAKLGIMVLVALYVRGYWRQRWHDYDLTGLPATDPQFVPTIASLSDSHIVQGTVNQGWQAIADIQSVRLERIAQAQTLIQFQTFMMTPGQRADAFAAALQARAQAGVTVQVLVDAYGARSLPSAYWQQLQQAGVEVRWFNPFSWRSPVDYLRRNHRKLLMIDQTVALVGGAGISDLWDGDGSGTTPTPWYDLEVEWQGEVVGILAGLFWQQWLSAGGSVNLQHHHVPTPAGDRATPILITPGEDPSTGNSPIRSLFQLASLAAQQRLWIASPYLLPDAATRNLLGRIQQRGVDVRILTMGPNNDKPYVYYVSRERYRSLLEAGVSIYEYQPSMMHAKLLLIDDTWVSIGSANLDPRSFFHNDELNLGASDSTLIHLAEAVFQCGFQHSHAIDLRQWQRRPDWQRVYGHLANLFYWQL